MMRPATTTKAAPVRAGASQLIAGGIAMALLAGAGVTAEWPTYQADAAHTGYIPESMDSGNFTLRWRITAGDGQPLNPIAVGGGKVFVTTLGYFSDAGLYVYDAIDGSPRWHRTYGDVFSVNPPAFAYGNVYLQTGNHADDTYLRAYDADSGQLVFQAPHEAQWESYFAPTIADGVAYIDGGYYGGMYAFDAHDGTRYWFHELPQYDEWTPAVAGEHAYAYVGDYDPGLYALDRASGNEAYMIPDPNFEWDGWSMYLAPTLGGADDVIAVHDGRLIRFDLAQREIDWEIQRSFTGQASVARGVIYVIDAGALAARDQITGALLWSWGSPQDTLHGPLIVTDSHVFVSGEARTYAVDLATHRALWSYPAGGYLALAEGALFIAESDGHLNAINVGPPPDSDGDGIPDVLDNCPSIPNEDQADADSDGVGDACNDAQDRDGDEWADGLDNCADIANPGQEDADGDRFGDVCDAYPQDPDNLGACLADVSELLDEVDALRDELQDKDGDGVIDRYDACEDSRRPPVDSAGCSQTQFCTAMTTAATCARADWLNDEPLGAEDCAWLGARGCGPR